MHGPWYGWVAEAVAAWVTLRAHVRRYGKIAVQMGGVEVIVRRI